MIKKVLFIFLITVSLKAEIMNKIENLIGLEDYELHKNLINHLFQNEKDFYTNDKINYVLVSEKLQHNGLLKLSLPSMDFIEINFQLNGNAKKSLNTLKEVLNSFGYYYYFPTNIESSDNFLKWSIRLKTAAAINPLQLSKQLYNRNCIVEDIKREGLYKWTYTINTLNCEVYKYENLIVNDNLELKKSLKPYLVKVNEIKTVNVTSNSGNKWHPKLTFYDKDFNVIEILKENSLHSNLKVEVPNNTNYIKIDDIYTLANLKRGINITKE